MDYSSPDERVQKAYEEEPEDPEARNYLEEAAYFYESWRRLLGEGSIEEASQAAGLADMKMEQYESAVDMEKGEWSH